MQLETIEAVPVIVFDLVICKLYLSYTVLARESLPRLNGSSMAYVRK